MLLRLIQVQIRVILALLLRETKTRFGKSRLGFLWLIFEPLLHTGMFTLFYSYMERRAPIGENMFLFLITGFVPFFLFRDLVTQTMNSISANKGLLEYPLVKNNDVLFARIIYEIVNYIFLGFIIAAICAFLGYQYIPDNIFEFMLALLLLITFGIGIGIVSASLVIVFPFWSRIISWLMRFLYLFSGLMFSVSHLPPQLAPYFIVNPLAHLLDMLRSGFYFGFDSDFYSIFYVACFSIILVFTGLLLELLLRKRIART